MTVSLQGKYSLSLQAVTSEIILHLLVCSVISKLALNKRLTISLLYHSTEEFMNNFKHCLCWFSPVDPIAHQCLMFSAPFPLIPSTLLLSLLLGVFSDFFCIHTILWPLYYSVTSS